MSTRLLHSPLNRRHLALCAGMVAALFLAKTAMAADPARHDEAFLKQAAENNYAEIESSRVALEKTNNASVKAFAQQMVDDHGRTGEELATLAQAKGVELPEGPSMMQKAKLELLKASDGDSFDRSYSKNMGVEAHQDTIKLFREAAEKAEDADVKAFATNKLPALEHHLELARQLPGVEADDVKSQ